MEKPASTQKKKRGRPKASKQIDKKDILDIAIQEFANKGFDGVRQRDIALQAGVANSLMNYHFDSKEDLWKQAINRLCEKLKERYIEIQGFLRNITKRKSHQSARKIIQKWISLSCERNKKNNAKYTIRLYK